MIGALEYMGEWETHERLQVMNICKSSKITPSGYCVAVSHDVDEFDAVNHAAKSEIMKVNNPQSSIYNTRLIAISFNSNSLK